MDIEEVIIPTSSKTAIAWMIFHQIISRSDEKLIALMTHPGGAQYTCLTVARENEGKLSELIFINLNGTSILAGDKILPYWERRTAAQVFQLADEAARQAGLTLREGGRTLSTMEFLLELLTTNKSIDIRNAWYDGSYGSCVSEEAIDFPHYPVAPAQNWQEHIPWWVILLDNASVAVCNLNTGELILHSGQIYQLNRGEKDKDMAMNSITKLEWEKAISDTQTLLNCNDEWHKRYAEYADIISNNIGIIKDARKTFREWEPLKFYLNVTNAKGAGKTIYFDVRYLGQVVAELKWSKDSLELNTQRYDAKNQKTFNCSISLSGAAWNSNEARKFRSHFKELGAVVNRGNEEHRIESMVLSEMLKTQDKRLRNMAPVLVGELRFPMPTPLKASIHKYISYSKQYGGGIDILARVGTGGVNTNLCIMELKDENKPKEPPRDAIKQALIYTTFIRELIRSESGGIWWKLFGFGSNIPDQLVLFASCVMPSNENNDTSFAGEGLNIGGNDIVRIHYLYFEESGNKIDNIDTSINK